MRTYSLISTNFVLAFSYHWYHPAPIPPPIPGVFVPHVEGGVPLGYSMILRNISDDVTFGGRGVVRVAHDVGFLIPHISIPPLPPNVWLLKDIPLSSAMVTFAKMNVLVNNISAGNFHVFMPMLVCGDMPRIRLPFGMVVDAPFRNTVSFNFTWTDLLLGIVNSILNFALAFAFGKLANWGPIHRPFHHFGTHLANKYGVRAGYFLAQRFGMSQMATRVTTYLVMESILAIAPVVLLDTVERGLEVVAHKLLHWETPLFGNPSGDDGASSSSSSSPSSSPSSSSSSSSSSSGGSDAGTSPTSSQPPPPSSSGLPTDNIVASTPLVCEPGS